MNFTFKPKYFWLYPVFFLYIFNVNSSVHIQSSCSESVCSNSSSFLCTAQVQTWLYFWLKGVTIFFCFKLGVAYSFKRAPPALLFLLSSISAGVNNNNNTIRNRKKSLLYAGMRAVSKIILSSLYQIMSTSLK